MRRSFALFLVCLASPLFGQTSTNWTTRTRIELRANYRDSTEESFPLLPVSSESSVPVGQTVGHMETSTPGIANAELSVAQLRLDLGR